MTLLFAFFMLATAILVGWAEAGKAPKKFPISQSLDRTDPSNPWLTQGCKQWEGNCDRKYNKTGTCKNDSVICDEGYYRGKHTPDDEPGKEYCYEEQARPYTCQIVTTTTRQTTTTTMPHTTTTRAPHTTTTTPQPQTTTPPEHHCQDNEQYMDEPLCPDISCDAFNKGHDRSGKGDASCMHGNISLPSRCYCVPNYARNENDICIPMEFCTGPVPPHCTANSHYEDCPQCNDLKCSDIKRFDPSVPSEPERPQSAKHRYCLESRCLCNTGFARDEDDNCAEIVGAAPNACDGPEKA